MQESKQYNSSKMSLNLPSLEDGYFWKIEELRYEEEWVGELFVSLCKEHFRKTLKFFRVNPVNVHGHVRVNRLLVGHLSDFIATANLESAITETANKIYEISFPQAEKQESAPISAYVGRYSA